MESTVVEVGITDIQQNQTHNIVEALQGAVSAALRQNGNANVTVVQLPTVFGSIGADPSSEQSDTDNQSSNSGGDSTGSVEPMDDATTENAINGTENEATAPPETADPTDGGAPTTTSTPNTDTSPSRQRTGTSVLAEVIQQMRTVQARLNPFVDQYYELLQNEPTFEENVIAIDFRVKVTHVNLFVFNSRTPQVVRTLKDSSIVYQNLSTISLMLSMLSLI